MTPTEEVRAALDEFDRTFASGDADALAALFADDAQLLLQHGAPIEGRPAILAQWARLFGEFDPALWRADHQIVEVHGDRAYSLSVYSETLVHRGDDPSRLVNGRLVLFQRRDPNGRWRISMAMNSPFDRSSWSNGKGRARDLTITTVHDGRPADRRPASLARVLPPTWR